MSIIIGEEFVERTKYQYLHTSEQEEGKPQPPVETPPPSGSPKISLPNPNGLPTPFKELTDRRTSVRLYARTPLSLLELSYLLWCTQGVKRVTPKTTLRTVPSAGARHAFDTYVLANRVEGLEPGIYRFLGLDQSLHPYLPGAGLGAQLAQACLDQDFVEASAATFIWVAVPQRMTWRYEARGYRYLFLDAGHVCENLYLAAESIGCGACAVAAFDDNQVNAILGVDGVNQFVIYLGSVGKKRE